MPPSGRPRLDFEGPHVKTRGNVGWAPGREIAHDAKVGHLETIGGISQGWNPHVELRALAKTLQQILANLKHGPHIVEIDNCDDGKALRRQFPGSQENLGDLTVMKGPDRRLLGEDLGQTGATFNLDQAVGLLSPGRENLEAGEGICATGPRRCPKNDKNSRNLGGIGIFIGGW